MQQAITTAAPALDTTARRVTWWPALLRDVLAPSPGRFNAMVRLVVATAIVLVTSMTLEVPTVALSLFIVFYLTRLTSGVATQNSVAVAIAAALGCFVATLTLAFAILIFWLTMDHPPLRLAAMALFFFVGMFAKRVFVLGPAGFVLAIVVLVTQAYVDLFPGPESAVRAVLWVWVAIVYPAAVAVGVNLLLVPADPEPLLRREGAERLRAVARLIGAPLGSADERDAAASLAAFTLQGSAPLLKLVRLAEMRDSSLEPVRAERTAKIQLLERLVESAAQLAELAIEPTPGQRARLGRVAEACERLAAAVSSGTALRSVVLPAATSAGDDSASALTPVIAELERVIHELPVAERPEGDQPAHNLRLLVPDAFTNPSYAQFALKATLAAMACYIAYTAVDWNGIHTCMLTCVIVALTSAGATIHKATLRLIGCAIGGGLALASIVFLMPHMTSIVQLMLLVAAVTAPAAWIAMGSERTGYLGVQLAFTFYLAVLQGFGPSTDVTEFRDRFVGILFGVVVMALVFAFVWPERAGTGTAQSLAKALRRMAELAVGSTNSRPVRAAAWQSLDEANELGELFAFEPEAFAAAGGEQGQRARRLIDPARRVLLMQTALVRQRESQSPAAIAAAADPARDALERAIAGALAGVANRVETGAVSERVDLRTPLAALAASRAATVSSDGEPWLGAELVDRVEALERAALNA